MWQRRCTIFRWLWNPFQPMLVLVLNKNKLLISLTVLNFVVCFILLVKIKIVTHFASSAYVSLA